MKALVIDDTLTSATLTGHLLRKMGIEPFVAGEGQAGIDLFKQHHPDLILLDVVMPGMSGYEVAKRIRQLERDGEWTPIIFLTASTNDEDLERGIAVGGDDYLVKPISEIVLTAKVRALQRIAQMRYSLVVLTRRLDEANRELMRLSSVDGLTGIANRRHFDEFFRREWARAVRHESEIAVLMCDVDHFKQYNDLYGHQAGDDCLRAVAQTLAARVKRPTDLVARYGGEEFAVILPDTGCEGARQLAEAMRNDVHELAIEHGASPARLVTLSVGVASLYANRGGPDESGLLRVADEALYAAKDGGRNCVVVKTEVSEVQ